MIGTQMIFRKDSRVGTADYSLAKKNYPVLSELVNERGASIVLNTVFFVLLFFELSALFSPANAFSIPEKLRYNLTWEGIKTGEAELEVRETGDEIQLISKANSSSLASLFYRVEDVVISTIKKGENKGYCDGFIGVPYNYRIKIH